ncbi:MAG: proton-conducting transporter membrane subunit, partial [Bacteroidota bacterium]
DRTGNREMEHFSGLASKMPVYTFFAGLFFFAGLGLPGMSGFVGELMVLIGAFNAVSLPIWVGVIAAGGIVISAAYFLWALQRMFFGKYFVRKAEWDARMHDLSVRELLMLIPIAILVVVLGVYPKLILSYSEETMEFFVRQLSLWSAK